MLYLKFQYILLQKLSSVMRIMLNDLVKGFQNFSQIDHRSKVLMICMGRVQRQGRCATREQVHGLCRSRECCGEFVNRVESRSLSSGHSRAILERSLRPMGAEYLGCFFFSFFGIFSQICGLLCPRLWLCQYSQKGKQSLTVQLCPFAVPQVVCGQDTSRT